MQIVPLYGGVTRSDEAVYIKTNSLTTSRLCRTPPTEENFFIPRPGRGGAKRRGGLIKKHRRWR